jgi:hypothetical protein
MVSGLSFVTVGEGFVAGVIVTYFGADTPPPGFQTVTCTDPALAMSDARIAPLNCVTPRNVVALFWPFHCTTDPDMKFEPQRVRSKAGPPATTCCGCRLEITGRTAPSCMIVKACPAMANVPIRLLVVALAATEYLTVPLPLPLLPDVMVIQETLLVAVHEQPAGLVTLTAPVSAPGPWLRLNGSIA